jgi:hypothetical protein
MLKRVKKKGEKKRLRKKEKGVTGMHFFQKTTKRVERKESKEAKKSFKRL